MTGMDEPQEEGPVLPRETLVCRESGVFRKTDYPWLAAVQVTLKGGDGGASSDGNPGSPGESASQLFAAADLADETPFTVGKGGSGGSADVPSGEDGYVMFELFDRWPQNGK